MPRDEQTDDLRALLEREIRERLIVPTVMPPPLPGMEQPVSEGITLSDSKRSPTPVITILGCDRSESDRALEAVWGYIDHPEYPQHKYIGKRTGGGAYIQGTYLWVWQTASGWHVEKSA